MIDATDLSRIRIINLPQGEAPLEVRKAWVGLEVPCLFRDTEDVSARTVFSKKPLALHDAYVVTQEHALRALAENNPKAADWWAHMGYPHSSEALFSFNAESVEEITPVPTKKELFDDMI